MYLKKIISLIALISFLNLIFSGCSAKKEVRILNQEIDSAVNEKIVTIVLPTGQTYEFKKSGAYYRKKMDQIVGNTVTNKKIELNLALKDLTEIRISKAIIVSVADIESAPVKEIILKNFRRIDVSEYNWSWMAAEGKIVGKSPQKEDLIYDIQDIYQIRTSIPKSIEKFELLKNSEVEITEIYYQNRLIIFDENLGKFVPGSRVIQGVTDDGHLWSIPVDDVLYVRVERSDPVKSFVAAIGILALGVAIVFLIALATKESCPFVYSFNGDQYIFDAEPLGGAIAKGLQKYDFSRLENLREMKNKYQLIFRNEVEEIQYLDEVKLLYCDHKPSEKVIPSPEGNFYVTTHAQPPVRAYDENNMDLSNFIKAQDNIVWQTHLPKDETYKEKSLRHDLRFTFKKPETSTQAQLIVNAGTALWGSNMIREMLQLRGDGIDSWYYGVNNHEYEFKELFHFIDREELYWLKISIKTDAGWVEQGYIPGGGPLITEDRILPLDLTNISGDSLKIRLQPPMGFWAIDYLAVEYNINQQIPMIEIPAYTAFDQNDDGATDLIMNVDQRYHIMPEVGDWLKVEFKAPPPNPENVRSIFLKTNGYYVIQIDKSQPEKKELIREIIATPEMIVDYAMQEYLKWRAIQLTSN